MGEKRKAENDSHFHTNNKKLKNSSNNSFHSTHHDRFKSFHSSDKEQIYDNLNPLRSRIRSLKRLLSHDDQLSSHSHKNTNKDNDVDDREIEIQHDADILSRTTSFQKKREGKKRVLPADVRIERERELASLLTRVEDIERRRARGKTIKKWHMIRFFERRKAERRLNKLLKKTLSKQSCEEEISTGGRKDEKGNEKDVYTARVDLNYALFYPLDRPYVSLWPRKEGQPGEENEENDEEKKGDEDMWRLVEKCMVEETLEDLREGRIKIEKDLKDDGESKKSDGMKGGRVLQKEKRDKNRQEPKKKKEYNLVNNNDNDDDGGFFEE